MSTNESRRTNNKERGRPKSFPRIEGISGQIGITIIDLGETLLGTLDLLLLN